MIRNVRELDKREKNEKGVVLSEKTEEKPKKFKLAMKPLPEEVNPRESSARDLVA